MLISGYKGWIGSRLLVEAQKRELAVSGISRETIRLGQIRASSLRANADCAIHLAAIAHVPITKHSDVAAYREANLEHALAFARLAKDGGCSRFLFVSTAKVLQTHALDPYTESKRAAEEALTLLHRPGEFDVCIVRPPLVYGPGVRANFLRLLQIADSPWPLLLNNSAYRQMVFLDNLVDALLSIAQAPTSSRQKPFIAYPQDAGCLSSAELLKALRGRLFRHSPVFDAHPAFVSLICGMAKSHSSARAIYERLFESFTLPAHGMDTLNWQPPHSVDDGLSQTVAWFQAQK